MGHDDLLHGVHDPLLVRRMAGTCYGPKFPAGQSYAPTDPHWEFDLLDPAGRFEDFNHLVAAGFSEAQVYFEIRDRGYPTIIDVGRRRDLWALSILGLL